MVVRPSSGWGGRWLIGGSRKPELLRGPGDAGHQVQGSNPERAHAENDQSSDRDGMEVPPSLSKAHRKPPEQMTVIVEDLIKMLDGIGNGYRRGRYPDARTASKIATVLRAVADELEL